MFEYEANGKQISLVKFESGQNSGFLGYSLLDAEGRSADLDYGYLAFGYNTDPDVVAARNTVATYSGPVDFGLFADSISVASGTPEIVLSADFSTNRISGAIDGSLEKGRLLYDVTLTMDPTDIEGNSFVSTFDIEVDGTVLSSVTSTAIEGAFFGPNAEEIAGTFYAEGKSGVDDSVLTGVFAAIEN